MRKILLMAAICLIGTMIAVADLVPTKIFIYGFSASFNDSTVYMTEIQEVDSAWVDMRTGFLYSRDLYSNQLSHYMNELGVPTPTCIVTFEKDRKSAEKKFMKLRKRYTESKDDSYLVKYISSEDFHFTAVSAADDVAALEQAKTTEKERRQARKEKKKEIKAKEKAKKAERKQKEKELKKNAKH